MGCAPSQGQIVDNDHLLQEIEHLKSRQTSQSEEIAKLQEENERLRLSRVNDGFDGHEIGNGNPDEEALVKEIEKLKISQTVKNKELKNLKEEINTLRKNNDGDKSLSKRLAGLKEENQRLKKDLANKEVALKAQVIRH